MFRFDVPAAVLGFVGVHVALRAEAAGVVAAVEAGDELAAHRRARLLGRVLRNHHETEDRLLWPALVERCPDIADVTAGLEADHVALDEALRALPRDLSTAADVRGLVEAHLLAEEQQAMPVWISSFTAEEHERFAGALRRSTPLREAGLMIAWLLDATPPEASSLAWGQVPRPLRMAHKVWFGPRYERRWGQALAA
ncbi:MAG TPA: hemerythrin domain-containing protein [Acidimicrobiales bacterium]|nr:hemerythrin domain-containing protein [Acidimicrobiales bacterium]